MSYHQDALTAYIAAASDTGAALMALALRCLDRGEWERIAQLQADAERYYISALYWRLQALGYPKEIAFETAYRVPCGSLGHA